MGKPKRPNCWRDILAFFKNGSSLVYSTKSHKSFRYRFVITTTFEIDLSEGGVRYLIHNDSGQAPCVALVGGRNTPLQRPGRFIRRQIQNGAFILEQPLGPYNRVTGAVLVGDTLGCGGATTCKFESLVFVRDAEELKRSRPNHYEPKETLSGHLTYLRYWCID